MRHIIIVILSIFLISCNNDKNNTATQKTTLENIYPQCLNSIVDIKTYDIYSAQILNARGVYVGADIVVMPLSAIQGSFSAKMSTLDNKQQYQIYGYTNYNIDDNLVALRVEKRNKNTLPQIDTTQITAQDTLFTLHIDNNKTLKTTIYIDSDTLNIPLPIGTPIYDNKGKIRAITSENKHYIDANKLYNIAQNISSTHNNIYDLRLKTNKVYPKAEKIRCLRIITTMGNIDIALSDLTPEYRDNYIKLSYDHFYDSLLIHRVLPNYLIQTGAADSKYAQKDDPVGWQGPGYKLPMHIDDRLYHKRGAVAASKLPQDHNASNRSDGSQFYIVTGRIFTNEELDEIEKDYKKKFTLSQRQSYTTVGGAPYLDGDYTVFGEVISGIEIADKIASVKLDGDRPVEDIRIKTVKIIYK